MKKLMIAVLIAALTAVMMTLSVLAAEADYVAPYAATEPKIDGKIDEIWNTAAEIVPAEIHDDTGMCTGYVKILWTQKALYVLEVAQDATLPEDNMSSANSFDLWISENNNQTEGYDTDLGDYHICVNSNGWDCPYTGNRQIYEKIEYEVAVTDDGYVVEIRIPFVMLKPAAAGHVMGFNVSLNDDFDNDDGRDSYSTWMAQDGHEDFYWSSTYLNTVQFGEVPEGVVLPTEPQPEETDPVQDTAVVSEEDPDTNTPDTNAPETNAANEPETNAPDSKAPETQPADDAPKSGLSPVAVIAIAAAAAVVIAVIVIVALKKKKA